jgi:hypothetical protein
MGYFFWIIGDYPVLPSIHIAVYNVPDSATCLTTWPVMVMPNRSYLSWPISTQVAVATWLLLKCCLSLCHIIVIYIYIYIYIYWCTGRLSLGTVQQWRFESGTEENHKESYEANLL